MRYLHDLAEKLYSKSNMHSPARESQMIRNVSKCYILKVCLSLFKSHLCVCVCIQTSTRVFTVYSDMSAASEPLTMSTAVPWLPVDSAMAVSEKMKQDWTAQPWPDSIHLRCYKTPQPQTRTTRTTKRWKVMSMSCCHGNGLEIQY